MSKFIIFCFFTYYQVIVLALLLCQISRIKNVCKIPSEPLKERFFFTFISFPRIRILTLHKGAEIPAGTGREFPVIATELSPFLTTGIMAESLGALR